VRVKFGLEKLRAFTDGSRTIPASTSKHHRHNWKITTLTHDGLSTASGNQNGGMEMPVLALASDPKGKLNQNESREKDEAN
jgi:hypothetical protein